MGREFNRQGMTEAGRRIYEACRSKGWTLAELSRRCGWRPEDDTRIYRYLRADAVPVADALEITKRLNLPISVFADTRGK